MRVHAAVGAVVLVLSSVVGFGSVSTAAPAEDDTFVVQFRGRAAGATLTDCDVVLMQPCTAWDVFAAQEVLRVQGASRAGTLLAVAVYAVTFEDGEPVIEQVAGGETFDATVSVHHSARTVTASGEVDLEVCELDPGSDPEEPTFTCVPTGVSVTIEMSLVAVGKPERYGERFVFGEPGSMTNGHFWGGRRQATVEATINGDAVVAVPAPYADGPWLFTDGVAELCLRCGFDPPL